MAFLDGELSYAEAQAVSSHLEDCAECAGIAEQFRNLSRSLSAWEIPVISANLDEPVREAAEKASRAVRASKPVRTIRFSFWNWRLWAIGGGGAVAAVIAFLAIGISFVTYQDHVSNARPRMMEMITSDERRASEPLPQQLRSRSEQKSKAAVSGDASASYGVVGGLITNGIQSPPAVEGKSAGQEYATSVSTPLIARTISLTIQVKDFAAARAALDSILARHQGYSAQLTVNTPENAPRDFHASLRIPAPELLAAIAELKTLGRVQNESQSGEEVTQQHADLVARLKNSRETEARLQAILQQRTGRIEDVLQVEEEIARVRGEIESMESDQDSLEHRVSFATVELQLTEEYKAQLNSPDASALTRMHNSFVAGFHNASETVLGIVLFLEEYGPTILIWLAILGVPSLLIWRRLRKLKSAF
jgi:hypothetical protein